jgi:transcriptional regulator with XRE-family HTH domain
VAKEKPKRKPRKSSTLDPHNRIAFQRIQQGLSQEDMVRLTGIPDRTYRRIESGENDNPGVRHLTNIAYVLGWDPLADIGEVCKAEWLEWQIFHKNGPKEPPPHEEHPERFVDPDTYGAG